MKKNSSGAAAAAAAWCRAGVCGGVAVTGLSQAAADSHK